MSAAQPKVHLDRGGDRPRCGTGNRTTAELTRITCERCILLSLGSAA